MPVFFILSKLLLFLLMPFWWIVILFIWRAFSQSAKIKKRLAAIIIILLLVFTNPFLYHSVVNAWQPAPVSLPQGTVYEAGIVLGGLSGYDKDNHGYFSKSSDRFIQTANLYHQGFIKKIMITGGTGKLRQNEPGEALFLKEAFIANGIKEKDIIIESRSKNTYENAVFTKKILDSLQIKPPYVLVTSAIHMPRASRVFTRAGFDCIAFPCDYRVTHKNFEIEYSLIPDIDVLDQWADFLKEAVGLIAYRLTGKA